MSSAREIVQVEDHGKLRADLRLHPQQGQDVGVRGGLVGALPGQPPLLGDAEVVGCGGGLQVGYLHVGLVEGRLRGHTQEHPGGTLPDEGIGPQFLHLLPSDPLDGGVHVASRLAEILLLVGVIDRGGDGKEGRKEDGGQGDGQHRHNVAGPGRFHGPHPQAADHAAVGDSNHPLTPGP